MPERSATPRPGRCCADLADQAMAGTVGPVMLLCNPLAVTPLPPMSSTERMRLLRARRAQGEPSPTCRTCGASWQPRMASFARLQAGVCSKCWRNTAEGQQERRERDRRRNASEDRRASTAERVREHRARKKRAEGAS